RGRPRRVALRQPFEGDREPSDVPPERVVRHQQRRRHRGAAIVVEQRGSVAMPAPSSPWWKSDRAEMGAAGPAARREEGEYSPYLTDEQRSRRGGSAR